MKVRRPERARPIVTIVVPYAAGGGTDAVARLIGEKMSGALGRTVIVENVVGAGGTIANDRVARSTPDGTTILINHTALLSAPSLFSNLRYETRTAFQPIGLVNIAPLLLVGRKTIPGSGPKDFVAAGGPVDSSPALAYDGSIYVGSSDGNLYALDAQGKVALDYVTGLGDLAGALPPPPPAGAGEAELALRNVAEQVGFGQLSAADGGKLLAEEISRIVSRG